MGAEPAIDAAAAALREAVRNSSLAIALLELPARRFVELSRRAAASLGSQPRALRGADILSISEQPDVTSRALDDVTDGVVDGYELRRRVRRSDGADIEVRGWVRVLERTGGRVDVLLIITSAHVESGAGSQGDPLVDHPLEYLFVPFLNVVHPHDLAEALTAIDKAAAERAQVVVTVRLQDGPRGWSRFRVTIGSIDGEPERFSFLLTPAGDTAAPIPSPERVVELEHHLRRIAREVEATGVARGFDALPDPETVPGLEDLTARQREVVNRLLRGERVAEIARAMYLSPSTVRNHLANLFRKVGVHSQSEFLELLRNRN